MFGNITDLPQLHTYRAALMHYNSITPIRGSDNLRPLCNTTNGRRKKHMQILKVTHPSKQGALDAVACRLYDTDVVTFLSNGETIINLGGWSTNTTHSFIDGIFMPTHYYSKSLVRAYCHKNHTVIELKEGKTVIKDDNVVKIRMVEATDTKGKYFEFVDAPQQYGYYLKRAQMGMRRKEVEKFTKFALALAKMVDPKHYASNADARVRSPAHYYYLCMTQRNMWSNVLEQILPKCVEQHGWYSSAEYTVSTKKLQGIIDDVLKYTFAEDLFEERETNNPLSNDNAKYIQGAGGELI